VADSTQSGQKSGKGGGCARIGERLSCLEDRQHVGLGSGGLYVSTGPMSQKGAGSLGVNLVTLVGV
jgi:hypothetical protein